MKVKELIEQLIKLDQERQVMVRDSIGAQDISRPIEYIITEDDEENDGDCQDRAGEKVYVFHI